MSVSYFPFGEYCEDGLPCDECGKPYEDDFVLVPNAQKTANDFLCRDCASARGYDDLERQEKTGLRGESKERKGICNITSPKWQLGNESAARFVKGSGVNSFGNYWEDWCLPDLELHVEYLNIGFDYVSLTERWFSSVGGKSLGGYIGVSYLPSQGDKSGNYHIGTPAGVKSRKLIAAMRAAMKAEKKLPPLSTEEIKTVFELRDSLILSARFRAELEAARTNIEKGV